MEAKWYYAENGAKSGPVSNEEIVKIIEGGGTQALAIWSEGMPGGIDAGGASGWSMNAPANGPLESPPELKKPTLARRLRNELVEYLAIASYLAVCFGALLFYKAAILESAGIDMTRAGLAIIKALILGKFVLILEHLKIGHSKKSTQALILSVLKKALLFTLLLILLTAIEEVVVGFIHGENARDALKGLGGGTRPEALATALLMFLILIPYFAYREMADKLGEEELSKLLFTRQPPYGKPSADALKVPASGRRG